MDELFKIFKVGIKDAKKIASTVNNPHKHDYEELIIGLYGGIEHFIDFRKDDLPAPFISFVTKGKVHRLQPFLQKGKFSAWVMRFKSEFIPETTFQLYSNYHDHANLKVRRGECFNRLVSICGVMFHEMHQKIPDYSVIRQLLSVLFTMIESERKKLEPVETTLYKTQNITFKNFLKILEENFRRPEGVDFYAEKLFMTARNLNLISQHILQKSVSEIIETRKLIEAKNLLMNSDKTVSEIGYELGFNEKAYFTNVFKKKSGQTPTEFREEMNRLIS